MFIPRYRTYWRVSGLWALPRIPYGARLAAGLALLFAGLPAIHALLDDPWRWAAHAGAIAACIGLACWKD